MFDYMGCGHCARGPRSVGTNRRNRCGFLRWCCTARGIPAEARKSLYGFNGKPRSVKEGTTPIGEIGGRKVLFARKTTYKNDAKTALQMIGHFYNQVFTAPKLWYLTDRLRYPPFLRSIGFSDCSRQFTCQLKIFGKGEKQ